MKFYTADICDHHKDLVQVVHPLYKSYGGVQTFHGAIHTIKLYEDNGDLVKLLRDTNGNGKVCVVDVVGDYCAVVGETLMGYAYKNEWSGIIVNGYIRDTHETTQIPVGLLALGTYPLKSSKKAKGEQQNILHFGGATFTPEHFIYADRDGVIVSAEEISL